MRTSVSSRRLGLRAALGISTSTTLWVCIAALGLAAVLKNSPRLMDLIRVVGGLYLLRLSWGFGQSAATPRRAEAAALLPNSARAAYLQGVATNATNPGTALFFTALLGLYDVPAMPAAGRLAVYGGIPLLSFLWYAALSRLFSHPRLSKAYMALRRPFDGCLAALFLFMSIKLILAAKG
jgi:threonine/homoserine/homoserine lactone efflux protein